MNGLKASSNCFSSGLPFIGPVPEPKLLLVASVILPVQSTNGYCKTCVVVAPCEPAKELAPKGCNNVRPVVQLALIFDLL